MQIQQINQQNNSAWGKDVAIVLFYGIFGGLFYAFSTDPERYSKCSDNEFLDWNKLTMIVLLSLAGISVIKLPLYICKFTQMCPTLWAAIESVGGIFIIICAIGLTVKDNKACGQLHTVAMVFYILVYVSLGILGLFICCSCLFCVSIAASAATQKTDDLENQPINQKASQFDDSQL
ncbi:hypothetical protein ABPG72_022007 [Tetrahymena utriculariae]